MPLYATNIWDTPGSGTLFEINFSGGYLSPSHIKVVKENKITRAKEAVPFRLLNPYTVELLAPVPGYNLWVYRETPVNEPLADFTDGAFITEANLDVATQQAVFAVAELYDRVALGLTGQGYSASDVSTTTIAVDGQTVFPCPYYSAADRVAVTVNQLRVHPSDVVRVSTNSVIIYETVAGDVVTVEVTNVTPVVGGGSPAPGGGSGDVVGTGPTAVGELAAFSGTDGKSIRGAGTSVVALTNQIAQRQAQLVSGVNLRTINGQSLLASGDLVVSGGGGTTPRLVVIGDSMAGDQPLLSDAWPTRLGKLLRASGANIEVHNLAINGWTFNKATTVASFGASTMVQKAVSLAPAIVIVALGANDAVLNVEGRSQGQIIADATTLFSTLRAALPSAIIMYGSEVMWDAANFHNATGTIPNKAVFPYFMQKRASGQLAGAFAAEMLDDPISSVNGNNLRMWVALDTAVKALGTHNGTVTINHFKATRLGLTGYDGVHLTEEGNRLLAAQVRKAFKTLPVLAAALPGLSNQDYASFDDPDTLFTTYLTSSGNGYVAAAYNKYTEHQGAHFGPWRAINVDNWFMPSKGTLRVVSPSYSGLTISSWMIEGGPPNSPVYTAVGAGDFGASGVSTDARGFAGDSAQGLAHDPISTAIRYKVGDEVYGPVTITVTEPTRTYMYARYTSNTMLGVSVDANEYILSGASTRVNTGGGTYNSATGTYTVPRAGVYQISATTSINTGANGSAFLRVRVDSGASIEVLNGQLSATSPGSLGTEIVAPTMSVSMYCAAGAQITFKVFASPAFSINVQSGLGNGSSWMTIAKIS